LREHSDRYANAVDGVAFGGPERILVWQWRLEKTLYLRTQLSTNGGEKAVLRDDSSVVRIPPFEPLDHDREAR